MAAELHAPEVEVFLSFPQHRFPLTLLSVLPKASVAEFVLPVIEFAVAVAIVVFEVALVGPASLPTVDSVSDLFVHGVVSFVGLGLLRAGLPHSVAIPESLLEVALERTAVLPHVLSITLGQPINVLSLVEVSICEPLAALPMLESVFEQAHVEVSVEFLVHPLPVGKAAPPLAFVVLDLLVVVGVFGGEIEPIEAALPVLFAVQELTDEQVAIRVYLDPLAVFLVIGEAALVQPALFGDGNALAFPLLPDYFPEINLAVAFDKLKLLAAKQRVDGKTDVGRRFVASEDFAELVLVIGEDMGERPLLVDCVDSQDLDVEAQLLSVQQAVLLREGHLNFRVLAQHSMNKI